LRNQAQDVSWKAKIELYQLKKNKLSLCRYHVFRTKLTNTGEFMMIIPPPMAKRQPIGPILAELLADERYSEGQVLIPTSSPGEEVYLIEWPWQFEPSAEAIQLAELVGDRAAGEVIEATTDHAWLVVLGHFAQALRMVAELEVVPLEQRQGANGPPQMKLIEFLVGILGGIEYLQELNRGAQPIATDPTIAEAWGQKVFGHYSQVSRTLEVADEETLRAVVAVLRSVSEPFIQAAVMETIKQSGQLTVDVDLTGREVSPTSCDYPEADFGWMDDGVSKGYQAAVTSLVCERWGRLMLTLQRYSGRTLSADCLQAAVNEVEELLQVRPRRRVELVQSRRQEMVAQLDHLHAKLDHQRQQEKALWGRIRAARREIKDYESELTGLEADYQAQGWTERPHSKLAKTRRKLGAGQKREVRAWRDLQKIQDKSIRLHQHINEQQETLVTIDEWLAYLEADNMANPNPVAIVLRIDAGFSTGLNLTWLIEMGYTVLTKAHHSGSTQSLRRYLPAQPAWTVVGNNAEAVTMGDYYQHDCPYPLQAMLVRYHLPGQIRYTTLFYYSQIPPPALPDWFNRYNARQTIEAGIKEEKGVFTLKRHLVRSPRGMQLQEQFALFGANFVRWAAAWVKQLLSQANQNFITALDQVKTLVRIVSRSRARWVRNTLGNTLIFDQDGPFAGTVICLAGLVAVQLPLRLFNFGPL
jgi:hypothetical protein